MDWIKKHWMALLNASTLLIIIVMLLSSASNDKGKIKYVMTNNAGSIYEYTSKDTYQHYYIEYSCKDKPDLFFPVYVVYSQYYAPYGDTYFQGLAKGDTIRFGIGGFVNSTKKEDIHSIRISTGFGEKQEIICLQKVN